MYLYTSAFKGKPNIFFFFGFVQVFLRLKKKTLYKKQGR